MISDKMIQELQCGATGFYLTNVPYDASHEGLYTRNELLDTYCVGEPESLKQCYDTRVFQHVVQTGKIPQHYMEMMGRSLHDFQMRKHVHRLLSTYDRLKVVGIMGGHALLRNTESYRMAALISKQLTELGYLMISGGGPGAMEATHFGAWMAGYKDSDVDEALKILSTATSYQSTGWYDTAQIVMSRYPLKGDYKSLAVPTWFYGHEPTALFATHIAKFFDNSIREDLLITEAYGGLIVMPGSAGTVQEIFQDAVQNHYNIMGFPSPIILVGSTFWRDEVPVHPFFEHMLKKGHYQNMLAHLVDTKDEVIERIVMYHKIYGFLAKDAEKEIKNQ